MAVAREVTGRLGLYLEHEDGQGFDLVDLAGRHRRGEGWDRWHLVHPTRVPLDQLSALLAGAWLDLTPRERGNVQAWLQGCSDPIEPLEHGDFLVEEIVRALRLYLRGVAPAPPLIDSFDEAVELLRELRLRRHALLRE